MYYIALLTLVFMKTNVNKKMLKLIFVVVMLDKLLVIMLVQNFGLRSFVVVDYS